MSDADQKQEDEVLRRMLATKPQPHKPVAKGRLVKRKPVENPADKQG